MFFSKKATNEDGVSPLSEAPLDPGGLEVVEEGSPANAASSTTLVNESSQKATTEGAKETPSDPVEQKRLSIYQGIEVVPQPEQEQNNNGQTEKMPPIQQPVPPPAQHNYQVAVPLRALQQGPAPVDCPVCGVREVTTAEYVSGSYTTAAAALFCVILCLGCIPYMVTAFKDVKHKCGHCGTLLAIWHRSGRTEVTVPGIV